jgi:hypothetical protein
MILAVVRQISDTVSVRRDGWQADGGLVERSSSTRKATIPAY